MFIDEVATRPRMHWPPPTKKPLKPLMDSSNQRQSSTNGYSVERYYPIHLVTAEPDEFSPAELVVYGREL